MLIASWLLCALCSPESEEIGSASHATPFPKGKLDKRIGLHSPSPGSPTAEIQESPSSPYMLAVTGPLSVANLLCHHLSSPQCYK